MRQRSRLFTLAALTTLILALSAAAFAAEWPQSVTIAGFTVRDISGRINNDGSGQGSGMLRLPGSDGVPVSLSRSSSGNVRASSSQRFSIGGASVEGSFELDSGGLHGSGTINTSGAAISGATFRMSPQGSLSGSGRVQLGPVSIPASFNASGNGLSVSGSAPKQVASETPLAYYTFRGDLQLSAVRDSVAVNARGQIERRGKVGNVADTFGPLTSAVNTDAGQVSFSVAGVNVTFRLW